MEKHNYKLVTPEPEAKFCVKCSRFKNIDDQATYPHTCSDCANPGHSCSFWSMFCI